MTFIKRVYIGKYGELADVDMDGLVEGLNVIEGPNESGKTTVRNLIRQVLYGFPTKTQPDAYLPSDGSGGKARSGRLFFVDDNSEFTVERSGGRKGGKVDVTGPDASEAGSFLQALTVGVTESVYKTIFCFGIDELAAVRSADKSEDHEAIGHYLLGAAVGTGQGFLGAKKEIDSRVDALLRPKSGGVLNELLKRRKDTAESLEEIRRRTDELKQEQKTLDRLRSELQDVESELKQKTQTKESLVKAKTSIERIEKDEEQAQEQARELERQRAEALRRLPGSVSPDALVDNEVEVRALEKQVSVFEQWVKLRDEKREESRRLADEVNEAAALAGLDAKTALAVKLDEGLVQVAESLADRIDRVHEQIEQERVEAAKEQKAAEIASTRDSWGPVWFGYSLILAGAAILVPSAIQGAWLYAVVGALLSVLGLVQLVGRLRATRGSVSPRETSSRARERLAGLESELDSLMRQWETEVVSGLRNALSDEQLARPPKALAPAFRSVLDAKRHERKRREVDADAKELQDKMDKFLSDLRQLAELIGRGDVDERNAAVVMEAVSEALGAAKSASGASAALQDIKQRLADLSDERRKTLRGAGLPEDSSLTEVGEELASVAKEVEDLTAQRDQVRDEVSKIERDLREQETQDEIVRRELEIANLDSRIAEAARRHAVLSVALGLLSRAQRSFEEASKPEVLKQAGRLMELITSGRYREVRIPLDDSSSSGKSREILLVDGKGREKHHGQLSRGTAEQLYLALRIARLLQDDGIGESLPVLMDDVLVDFDPERAKGAARAIADLAARRQVLYFTCHPATADLLVGVAKRTGADSSRKTLDVI
ncbi:MAG: hypothetical protein Kow0056_07340 [Coriobacteriia bacterium]